MIYLDIETYCDLDIRNVGVVRYAEHPSTEVLVFCYALDDGPVQVLENPETAALPPALQSALDAGHELCAHNSAFDATVLARRFWSFAELDPARWVDTSLLARTCGLPHDLATLSTTLRFDDGQHKIRGARLVQRFCKPTPKNYGLRRLTAQTNPEEWAEFLEYCREDVEKTRRIWHTLPRAVFQRERRNWYIDQDINARGLPIDTRFAQACVASAKRARAHADERIAEVTQGQVPSISAISQLARYVGVESADAANVATLLASRRPTATQRLALELRQRHGGTASKKYAKALEVAYNGRVYDTLMFYGACRTGRAAGRLLQPQNMARPNMPLAVLRTAREVARNELTDLLYDDDEVPELLGRLVRTLIAAPPGKKFVVADLANIEGRMLAWLAGEHWKLEAFRAYDRGTGPDLYRLAYARSFGLSVDAITKDQRQVGKVMELALGYQGGVGAFEQMAATYGVRLPPAVVSDVVRAWRKAHPEVVKFWRALERAALDAVRSPQQTVTVRGVTFGMYIRGALRWLVCRLPSGRHLMYFDPRIEVGQFGLTITYWGQVVGSNWARLDMYGGKWAENITQACARDVLIAGIERAHAEGFPMVMHAHDEIVAECDDTPEWSVQRLCDCMTYRHEWFEGLPLAAEGYEDYYYRKD